MNNLFAFGCSLTYGHGMEDNWDSNNNRPFPYSPSKKAWPFLLANMLNYNCVNLARCGASNKEILYLNSLYHLQIKNAEQLIIRQTHRSHR